jgi:glycosyltransferase involved in cell wall biosynthesis
MISVVLPAFNESETLRSTVSDVNAYMKNRGEDYEIIMVENGSTDNTAEIAEKLAKKYKFAHYFHQPLADYGNALRRGFRESQGDIVVNFDVDFYDLDFLERAINLIRNTHDNRPSIVVGSKRSVGARDERPILRRCATFVFSSLLRFGFGLGVTDTHGVKAFHRASVAPYEEQCHFGIDLFDTELILRCEQAGLVVNEIPVTVKESRPARSGLLSRVPRTLLGLTKMKLLFIKESFVRRTQRSHVKMHS